MASFLSRVTNRDVQRRALRTAAVVGTVLNLINHGPALADSERLPWLHVMLNFLVPYAVSSYSAAASSPPPEADQ